MITTLIFNTQTIGWEMEVRKIPGTGRMTWEGWRWTGVQDPVQPWGQNDQGKDR